MNNIIIVGRLTKEPEISMVPEGIKKDTVIKKATLNVAVTRERDREKADFFQVVAWRGLAEICEKYIVKGQRVCVQGSINTYTWDDAGTTRYGWNVNANSIEMLDKPQEKPKTAASESPYGRSYKPAKKEEAQYNPEDLFAQADNFPIQEDELPF